MIAAFVIAIRSYLYFAKRNNDNTIMLLLQSKTIISQLIELQQQIQL